jgi:Domain of unknown function(DUF2779)
LTVTPISIDNTPIVAHTQPRLSKSRIMSGLQCHKRLWLETYHRELMVYGEASQAAFAQGNFFGELARDLIAHAEQQSSYLVAATEDPQQALKDTAIALDNYGVLFEPAFRYEGVFVRTDALIRHDRGDNEPSYTMVEVKAASNVKPQYIRDSAIQIWVLRGTGLNVTRVELGYVNTHFIYDGDSYTGLLKRDNITVQVENELLRIQGWIDEQRDMLRLSSPPNIAMGRHCTSPYTCPFLNHCTDNKPIDTVDKPEFSIMLLPGVKGKVLAKRLQELGHTDLLKVPINQLEPFEFVQEVYRSGQPWHNVSLAYSSLMAHPKPWAYLDFETISPAVPLWAGMQPFSHWPFQWSVHLEAICSPSIDFSNPINLTNLTNLSVSHHTHHDFLDLTGKNPSLACVEKLLSTLQNTNTIWAYNAAFERQVILRLAKFLPQHTLALQQLAAKLQDLIPIVQSCYYHPAMQGSYSLKSILPAIAPELDYQHLQGVQNGNAAQSAFFEATSTHCTPERQAQLTTQLRAYCQLDTWAMVVLVERLLTPQSSNIY